MTLTWTSDALPWSWKLLMFFHLGGPSLAFVYQVCTTFGNLSSRFFAEFRCNGKTWGQEGSGMKKKKKTLNPRWESWPGFIVVASKQDVEAQEGRKACRESSGDSKCTAWSAIRTQAESHSSQMEHSDHQLYQVMLKQSWKGCAGDHIQDGMQRDQGSRLYEPKKVPLCVCLVLDCIGVSCWWRRHKNQSEAWHLEGWSRKMERSWPAKTVGLSVEIMLRVMLWVTSYCVKLFPTVSWPEILHLKQILTLFWMQTQRQDAG